MSDGKLTTQDFGVIILTDEEYKIRGLEFKIKSIQTKLQKATEALEFYGDEDKWKNYGTVTLEDNGTLARTTLAEIKGKG